MLSFICEPKSQVDSLKPAQKLEEKKKEKRYILPSGFETAKWSWDESDPSFEDCALRSVHFQCHLIIHASGSVSPNAVSSRLAQYLSPRSEQFLESQN